MTLKQRLTSDLPKFLNTAQFADLATIAGIQDPVAGLFDPGIQDGREPRSPAFTCRDTDIASITHGAQFTIPASPGQHTGGTFWLEGYRPDGYGMATCILRET